MLKEVHAADGDHHDEEEVVEEEVESTSQRLKSPGNGVGTGGWGR